MLIAVTFFSCGDDNEKDELLGGMPENLIGTWSAIKDEGHEVFFGEKDSWNKTYKEGEEIIIFKSDGTCTDGIDTGIWSYEGNKLTIDFGDDSTNGDDSDLHVYTILELTDSRLVIEILEKEGGNEFYQKLTCKKMKE